MIGIGRSHVARRIAGGDCRTHIAVRGQHRSRYTHTPGLTVGVHRGLVGLGADGDRHRITRFHVVIDLTGDGNGLARLAGIDHVIGGDVVDRNGRRWRNRIHTVSVIRVCRGDIACGIACGDGRRDITVRRQYRPRNIHAPGLAIGIYRGLIGLGTDCHGDCIARFHFIADVTRHRNGLTGFNSVNHVIRRDIIDRDRGRWRHRIHTVSVGGVHCGHITCSIAGSDGRRDITVRCQHRTRHIDAPGLAVGIHRRLIGLGTDSNGDRITGFHIVIDVTGDRNRLTQFAGINHVIGRDVINSNRRSGCHRIHTVSVAGIGGGHVTCGIAGSHRGRDIAIGCQH
ncbi:hypothetical protein PB72LOC_03997 [Pectobacterium atrosepticum]|nr:hypothetical protein PB72LOC_03997 [Pectobacterium atrosepticum]